MSLQTPPSLDDLLRILDAATDKGGLHWTTTAEEGTFRAELGIGMVRLAKEGTGPRYKLTLLDSDGTLLEEYLPSGEGPCWQPKRSTRRPVGRPSNSTGS